MSKSVFHILVVEDDPVVGADIAGCLADLGYGLVSQARNFEQALSILETDLPDLAFLDIDLGQGRSGIDLGKVINREFQIPFVFLTAHSDDPTLREVRETLPSGFVLKPFHEQRLKAAIEIARHNYYTVISKHWQRPADVNRHLIEPLTARELDLLALVCEGKSNRELAEALHLSINTIKTHLKNLYLKLEVRNRAEVILKVKGWAIQP